MAEPIKTTVQEALSHIKSWIDSGEKDKAIKGLEEILSHEPGNIEAKNMMDGLVTPKAQVTVVEPAPVIASSSTATTVSNAAPAPAVNTASMATTSSAVTPAPIVTAPPVTPSPAVMPPSQATPLAATPATPGSATSTPPTPISSVSPANASVTSPLPKAESKIAMIMHNMKWIVTAGALLTALIGGYVFYKNVLSVPGEIAEDLQQEAEKIQSDFQDVLPESSADSENSESVESPESPLSSEPSPSTKDNKEIIPTTSVEIETSATTSSESGEKVKRR